MTIFLSVAEWVALGQVILTDLTLAADNAIVIGMAAARLGPMERRRAIMVGIAGATLLRVLFALFVVQLLQVVGLLLVGGLLLLWVSWNLWRELARGRLSAECAPDSGVRKCKSLGDAVWQIIIADVSMSLDNVLAVAGAAREHVWILAIGLVVSVALMGFAATWVARLLIRRPWIAYLGLLVILIVCIDMIADGVRELIRVI